MKKSIRVILIILLVQLSFVLGHSTNTVEVPVIFAPDKFENFSEGQKKELVEFQKQVNRNFKQVMDAIRNHTH